MKQIWKFPVPVQPEPVVHLMPLDAWIIYVDTQGEIPCLWAVVDHRKPTEKRSFVTVGTGHDIIEEVSYVGSYQLLKGAFVGHIFEYNRS